MLFGFSLRASVQTIIVCAKWSSRCLCPTGQLPSFMYSCLLLLFWDIKMNPVWHIL